MIFPFQGLSTCCGMDLYEKSGGFCQDVLSKKGAVKV
jgi:hypothetical protein